MLSLFNSLRGIDMISILFRLMMAFLSGGVIGAERSYKNRAAGFRTHILVCVGASTASLIGIYLYVGMKMPADISRIGAQVITGLGFLGGGTIIVTKDDKIKGLTTAAGLWTTGIIGLAIGAGFYEIGILGVILVLIAESCFSQLTTKLRRFTEFQCVIHYQEKTELDKVLRHLKDANISITNLRITSMKDDDDNYIYTALLQTQSNSGMDYDALAQYVKGHYDIIDFDIIM